MNDLSSAKKGTDTTVEDASERDMPKAVLFVCNHNVIRSPMAEALMRHHHGQNIYSASAGIRASKPDPFVDSVLAETGIGLAGHEPQTLQELDEGYFDMVVALSREAHGTIRENSDFDDAELLYWETGDPTLETGSRERRLDAYRAVRDSIERRILERFPRLDETD